MAVGSHHLSICWAKMSRSQKEVKQLVIETFKTADEIRCRLFDHQQFSHGEISFFVKEFQEKRLDSDLGRTSLDVATASVVNSNQSLNEAIDFLQSDKIEAVCSRSKSLIVDQYFEDNLILS